MKYRHKPTVVEASQWRKNGDHPLDYVREHQSFGPGATLKTYSASDRKRLGWEGDLVRYFRHPGIVGSDLCPKCGQEFHIHGWIDREPEGLRVCPGDWIVEGLNGEHYPMRPEEFAASYEVIE